MGTRSIVLNLRRGVSTPTVVDGLAELDVYIALLVLAVVVHDEAVGRGVQAAEAGIVGGNLLADLGHEVEVALVAFHYRPHAVDDDTRQVLDHHVVSHILSLPERFYIGVDGSEPLSRLDDLDLELFLARGEELGDVLAVHDLTYLRDRKTALSERDYFVDARQLPRIVVAVAGA